MKIAVGADHGGYELKESLKSSLEKKGHEVVDFGCHGKDSVDYPDYAREVASRVSRREVDEGLLVCTTGLGMSIAANKYPGVRAALCLNPSMASTARTHNNANVLVLGQALISPEEAEIILAEWLEKSFPGTERHARRFHKIEQYEREACETADLALSDPESFGIVAREVQREQETLDLIASENYAGPAVRRAQGSVLTNKYAEGYPGKRWYQGCVPSDDAEALAISRAIELFGADHANVQPHCGSSANMAVYFSVLEPGDGILAMSLAHGGHLTHGHKINFSGRLYKVVSYGVSRETERIDFDEVARLAKEHRVKLIVAGASAYSRPLEFDRFREVADSVGAALMVDMAHIAGLVAGGAHQDPVPYAEFVTSTTHKTLRGPRGGLVLCRKDFAQSIDREVFPGLQGGPLMHTILSKAVCFKEAMAPDFKEYAAQTVANARRLADNLASFGFRIVSGGTDNHLLLVDLTPRDITGKDAAASLEKAGIVLNKNCIPFDSRSPFVTSGIRIGTPAVTTRGMKEDQMDIIAGLIKRVLDNMADESVIAGTRKEVSELAAAFPAP